MCIKQMSQRIVAESAPELARFEARILRTQDVHYKQLQTLEGVQGQVTRILTEKSITFASWNKSSKTRALAEESHQKHLQSLLEKTRAAKERAAERERAGQALVSLPTMSEHPRDTRVAVTTHCLSPSRRHRSRQASYREGGALKILNKVEKGGVFICEEVGRAERWSERGR
ncbi:uncharacterized protein EDB91DRAFT_144980 [Suillus paluster]|uniref:uncharacterized protein n=1 Tax=Suillus paluster TaxID=48578 RepID=UPI001B8798D2|nr:uncharacterized protein EDB91DRAFT_144980 [Suillus paluster]KAG1724102.1 hypothetical protein EDB91DRAFT_144980 [Suillus paluster]